MNSTLDSALQARLQPVLAELETGRQSSHAGCKNSLIWCLGVGFVGALLAFGAAASNGVSPLWAIAPFGIALGIYGMIYSAASNAYSSGFKAQVMPPLVAIFGELRYSAEGGIDETEFVAARLTERPDRYSTEDLVEGRIGATAIRFCEVKAERRETRRDSKGRTTTHYVTFFRGLFIIADFNKNLSGVTYVLPDGFTGSLGGFGAGLQSLGGKLSGRGDLVSLEDLEFEAQFKVFGSDQIEARYVLSSALMRRFLDLKAHFSCPISAVFRGQSLFLCIETGRDYFEPPALSEPLSFESLQSVIGQLQSATGIVETLDLNTRIWTKE